MATTQTYGRIKPETGDRGSTFFPALETNIDKCEAHDHDGVTGKKIASKSLTSTTSTIQAADWSADQGGSTYFTDVTLPSGVTFENHVLGFIDASGCHIFPTVEKQSATVMRVTVNDNTLDLTVVYG